MNELKKAALSTAPMFWAGCPEPVRVTGKNDIKRVPSTNDRLGGTRPRAATFVSVKASRTLGRVSEVIFVVVPKTVL
ncbi:MAG: hypothetical protein FD129_11 [bacterium]|nr:MAG: hypothetical protein FD129_11 [bacterium]